MPFYEYECSSCKFYTELLQKVSDPPLKKCPSCRKSTMKKLVSAPVFRLKGGGWYETDFKSDKEGRRNLAVEKEPAANDASMEGTAAKPADAKAAAAPDSKAADAKPAESKPSEPKPAAAAARRRSAPAKRPAARAKPRRKASSRSKRR